MTDVPSQDHTEILREVGDLKNNVVELGRVTVQGVDHFCFEAADTALERCRSAISGTKDRSRIVAELQKAYDALAQWVNGPAAPAVVPAREQLQRMWGRL